jgi:hypothetical protein
MSQSCNLHFKHHCGWLSFSTTRSRSISAAAAGKYASSGDRIRFQIETV